MSEGIRLYHFWSSPESQRVRLALGYKAISWEDHPLDYQDDATFFDLGVARAVPVLVLPGQPPLTDSTDILWRADALFPDAPPLVASRIDESTWTALLDWRRRADHVLQRLYAPVGLAYRDIGRDAQPAYARAAAERFGMSLEALASDRYDGYLQLAKLSRLPELAHHLARDRFFTGSMSIADALLAADLFPLQLLDGVTLPIDLMYYLERVQDACGIRLGEGLIPTAHLG